MNQLLVEMKIISTDGSIRLVGALPRVEESTVAAGIFFSMLFKSMARIRPLSPSQFEV